MSAPQRLLAWLLLSAVLFAAGLSCAREETKPAPPTPQRSAAHSPSLPPEHPAPPISSAEPEVKYLEEPEALRVRQAMRSALLANDRKRLVASLLYPVIVHTDSWCKVRFRTTDEVLAHYDEIFTKRARQAILGNEKGWSMVGSMLGGGLVLGRGEVWLGAEERVTSISSDIWTFKDRECENWKLETIPDWLDGDWAASSVAQVQGASQSPKQFEAAFVRVDLRGGVARVALTRSRTEECKTLRYGYELEERWRRDLTPGGNGFPSRFGREYFFDLECRRRRIERLYPYSNDVLGITADDAFVVFFKRNPSGTTSRTAALGEPCGAGVAGCPKLAACVAQWPDKSVRKPFDEVCQPLKEMPGLKDFVR